MSVRRWLSRRTLSVLLGCAALGIAPWSGAHPQALLPQAEAIGTRDHRGHRDHELARQALQQGKVLPLRTVLERIEQRYQGQVVKIEFEHHDGRFIYEMRLLHPNGQLSKLEVDAVDGRVIRIHTKGHD